MQKIAQGIYSEEDILEVLTAKTGSVTMNFEYHLLDANDKDLGILDNVESGQVEMHALNDIKRIAQFHIRDKGDINFLKERIQPFVCLKMGEKKIQFKSWNDCKPIFSRNSVAYKSDGTLVNTNVPRFESGKFGQAVLVEEGTTNLLNSVYANGGLNSATTGGTTIITTEISPLFGTNVALCSNDGTVAYVAHNVSGYSDYTVVAGQTYVFSCWAKPKSGSNTVSRLRFTTTSYGTPNGTETYSLLDYSNPNWQRLVTVFTSNTNQTVRLSFYTAAGKASACSAYVCGFQLEQKPYATSFVDGTRSAETLTIPTAGVLNPQEGTVECWFYYKPNNAWQRIVSFVGAALNGYRDLQFDITNTSYVRFQPKKLADGTGIVCVFSANPITEGWHYAVCTWNQSEIKVAVDNQPVQKLSYGGGIATLDTYFTVGKEHNNTLAYLNSLIDDLRISNRARTDAEIAAAYASGQPLPVDEYTTCKMAIIDGKIKGLSYQIQTFTEPEGWVKYPQGIFLLSTPKRKDENNAIFRDIDGFDKSQMLENVFETRYSLSAGITYDAAIKKILNDFGIDKVNIEPTPLTLQTVHEWAPGTKIKDALMQLTQEANYIPIIVDEWGYFTTRKYISPADRTAEFTYQDGLLSNIIPGMEVEEDWFSIPNKWVCTVSNSEQEPLISSYVNNNPDSPTSVVNRGGLVIPKVWQIENIADQASLDEYVQRTAYEDSQIYSHTTFESMIIPFHSYDDVIWVKYSLHGIDAKFSETDWVMPLDINQNMKHEVRRVVTI